MLNVYSSPKTNPRNMFYDLKKRKIYSHRGKRITNVTYIEDYQQVTTSREENIDKISIKHEHCIQQ